MGRAASLHLAALLDMSLAATMPAAAEDGPTRFQVRGEILPLARSDEGRFALSAEVRMTPGQASDDGRFVLKSVNVPEAGCDLLLDLFANGFEG